MNLLRTLAAPSIPSALRHQGPLHATKCTIEDWPQPRRWDPADSPVAEWVRSIAAAPAVREEAKGLLEFFPAKALEVKDNHGAFHGHPAPGSSVLGFRSLA